MDDLSQKSGVFTGLILLTGSDAPGIAQGLFRALADFSIQIDDVEQLIISDRLVLTVLITLNPVHQNAIEADLFEYARLSGVDIATVFTEKILVPASKDRVTVNVVSGKMHPKILEKISSAIVETNGNIESISRTQSEPTGILFVVTGASPAKLSFAIEKLEFEDNVETRVNEL